MSKITVQSPQDTSSWAGLFEYFSNLDLTSNLLVLQTIIFTLTLVAIVRQSAQARDAQRILAYQHITDSVKELDVMVFTQEHLGEFLEGGDVDVPGLSTKETAFIYYLLNFWEMLFIMQKKKVISSQMWQPWERNMMRYFLQPKIRLLWDSEVVPKNMYYDPFRDHVNHLLNVLDNNQANAGGNAFDFYRIQPHRISFWSRIRAFLQPSKKSTTNTSQEEQKSKPVGVDTKTKVEVDVDKVE